MEKVKNEGRKKGNRCRGISGVDKIMDLCIIKGSFLVKGSL